MVGSADGGDRGLIVADLRNLTCEVEHRLGVLAELVLSRVEGVTLDPEQRTHGGTRGDQRTRNL